MSSLPSLPALPLPRLSGWRVHKLRIPLGRMIGDCGAAYDTMEVLALRLETQSGLVGWGYAVAMPEGYFERTGWWIKGTQAEAELQAALETSAARRLWMEDIPLDEGLALDLGPAASLRAAWRWALWDLAAKARNLSVAALLGEITGRKPAASVPVYGSPVCFPLTDAQLQGLVADFVRAGIRQVKVKVGAPDIARDLHRLRLVKEVAGPDIALTADANEAWDADTCIARVRSFMDAGTPLGYIEDPLPRDDWAGYARLRKECPVPVAGHDYFDRPELYERAARERAFHFFRSGQDTRTQLSLSSWAAEAGMPIYYGNSLMEQNVHAAAVLPGTVKLEFAKVAWHVIGGPKAVPLIEHGRMRVFDGPGYGLDADPEALRAFARPEASPFKLLPCPWKKAS